MGDDEEQAELERAIALSLADNDIAAETMGSSSALKSPSEHRHETEASQDSQPSLQGEQPVVAAASSSHEARQSGGRTSGADGKSCEADSVTKEDEAGGQPGGASISGRNLHAMELSNPVPEAADPPELFEAGPSSSHEEHASRLQDDLQLEQPSSSGTYQGISATLHL